MLNEFKLSILNFITGLAEARVNALQGIVNDHEGQLGRMRLSEVLDSEERYTTTTLTTNNNLMHINIIVCVSLF